MGYWASHIVSSSWRVAIKFLGTANAARSDASTRSQICTPAGWGWVSHLIQSDGAAGHFPSQSKGCGAQVSKGGARTSGEGSLPAATWRADRDAGLPANACGGCGCVGIAREERDGAFRVFYYLASARGILVFHAFVKKAQRTPPLEIELARKRFKELLDA
jgi:hypothetical protein